MDEPDARVAGIDVGVPNVARVYDALLGGTENFAADRALAARMIEMDPALPGLVRQNREFVGRVVGWAALRGVRQFIDLGAGLPSRPAVHEIAASAIDGARVVYVDNDPVVVRHAQSLLAGPDGSGAAVVQADLTRPEVIMSRQTLADMIDPAEPVCLLIASVLHFMPADVARALIAGYARLLPAGSVVAVSVFGADDPEIAEQARQAYTAARTYTHTREDIASFLRGAGLELAEQGVVRASEWRGVTPGPGQPPAGPFLVLAAVGVALPTDRPASPMAQETGAPGSPATIGSENGSARR